MGFRNRIKIRFLVMIVAAVLFGGSFCSRGLQLAQDLRQDFYSNNQSGSSWLPGQMWIAGCTSRSFQEQVGGNLESQDSFCCPSLCLNRLLEYVFLDEDYTTMILTGKLDNVMFHQRFGRKQAESCLDCTHWSLKDILNQLIVAIFLLLVAHRSTLEAIAHKVIKTGVQKNDAKSENDLLTNLKAFLYIFITLAYSSVSSLDNNPQEDEDLQLENKMKYSWLYDPLRWTQRFTEYFSVKVYSVLDRIASYRPLSSLLMSNVPSFLHLAEAGFMFQGAGTAVECDKCRNVVDIKDFDSPAVEAKYHREGCIYVKMANQANSDERFNDIEEIASDAAAAKQNEGRTLTEHVICDESTSSIRTDNSSIYLGNQFTNMVVENTLLNESLNDESSLLNSLSSNSNCPAIATAQISQDEAGKGGKHEFAEVPTKQQQKQFTIPAQQQIINATLGQQQINEAAAQGQQQRQQTIPPVQQKTTEAAAQGQQQRQQTVPPVQQQTGEAVAQGKQQMQPPIQQQKNEAAAHGQQQRQQTVPPVQQKTTEAAAQGEQQRNQTAPLTQQQTQSLVSQAEMGACAAPVGSTDSASIDVSNYNAQLFDLDEFDAEAEKCDHDHHENESTCLKNPGHYSNYPMRQLKLDFIPSNVRHPEVLRLFQLIGKLVVRVVVRVTSENRPPVSNERDKNTKFRFGTGMAYVNPESKDAPAATESSKKWNTVRRFIPLLKNSGYVYIQTNRHLVYDDFEAQNTTVEFFYDNPNRKEIVSAKGMSIEHSYVLGDSKSILKCKLPDASVIEFVKNTKNEIMALATGLPQKIKENLMKRVFVISHPHGREKVLSYGDYVMVKYALKAGQQRAEMVKINNHTQISKNPGDIRKVLFYTADTCKGASGAVVVTFVKKINNNVEDLVLDLWMHCGVSKKHGLNASVMRELTPEDIASHGTPNSFRPSIQDDQEAEANSAANQVVSCPVYTVIGAPSHPAYAVYSKRLGSYPNPFHHVHTAVDLADGGFFYAGYADCVRCFNCGLGLRSWKHGDIINVEHNKNRPDCQFLQMMLKATGANQRELQSHHHNRSSQTSVQPQTVPRSSEESHQYDQTKLSTVVQQPEASVTESAQTASKEDSMIQAQVSEHSSSVAVQQEMVMENAFQNEASPDEPSSAVVNLLEREQKYLKQLLVCKICFQKPAKDLFLPCGELVACLECSKIVTHCPSCNTKILATVTTFFI